MNYFVTGATGLIGRFLVEQLLQHKGSTVTVLMREQSMHKFDALRAQTKASKARLVAVTGDVTVAGLLDDGEAKKLPANIDHVYHLAAVYDMDMTDEQGDLINNGGTRNVVNFVNERAANQSSEIRLHHVSSVAVAGNNFEGVFTESMFDEGQSVAHPYYRTKFQSEKIVREKCLVPWRVYRPGMVLGHSETGEMDKVDGPYYFFKTVQRLRDALPKWLPLLMIEGGKLPLAPVDYVVKAIDAISHKEGVDGQAFHLVQSDHPTVGELMKLMFEAAHGPEISQRYDVPLDSPASVVRSIYGQLPTKAVEKLFYKATGMPLSILGYVDNQASFDDKNTQSALKGSKIECPPLDSYLQTLWNYWETFMDLDVDIDRRLPKAVQGKTVLITGASSGIGFTTAKKMAKGGAHLLLVARGEENLLVTKQVVESLGGTADIYPTDLNDMVAIDGLVTKVLADHGHVDVLINNAGRSIRRAVIEAVDRFHDYERTMQLNYFGCIRLIMGLLPSMTEQGGGHIINISSIGCLTNVPRFSAYVASKSALDAFSRCLSAEVKGSNIDITTIYMPLVRTPMIAPTKLYDYVPTLTPDQAANMLVGAVITRPKSIKSPLGTAAAISYALVPKLNDTILSQGFKLFPSSKAARGGDETGKPSREGFIFARLFRGTYW